MEPVELINEIREELKRVEESGQTHVPVTGLRQYLSALELDAQYSFEERRRSHEGTLAHYAAQNQFSLEMFKSVLETGKSAIDALLIINGGAVVAMLGVLSNLAGKSTGDTLARHFALPLLQFGIGVLLAACCFAFRYFSQAAYADSEALSDKYRKRGDRLKCVAVVVGVAGYIAFGFGIANSYEAVLFAFSP
ncbi:hypothetical protein G7069_04305 [Lysobacter sp. HDW10]|uniref:hypothetical protein n=1 Tax=Lysobacter sp. HDW10 TaxID=2714936 RepID=UPI00140BFF69|nr:hypothetical protein [Lysobacter sp. HDW10]QIK80890.1 hypothetical protein G7069_04305 [Lysobacter sp. HDW10]